MEMRYDIAAETDQYVSGQSYSRDAPDRAWEPRSSFVQTKRTLWFTQTPQDILKTLGVTVDARRAREFADLIDGDLDGFTYLAIAASTGHGEEALKWIMGGLAATLNERSLPFSAVGRVLPPDYLAAFVEGLAKGAFERAFAKDIFAALLAAPGFRTLFGTDEVVEDPDILGGTPVYRGSRISVEHIAKMLDGPCTLAEVLEDYGHALTLDRIALGGAFLVAREEMGFSWFERRPGEDVLGEIVRDPRFKAADTAEIDRLIEEVIAANPDKASAVSGQPKLAQWFVGQVMKAVKAKGLPPMPAPTVVAKLNQRFGVA